MNIIITMAGLGSRFKKAGFSIPKYKITAGNKTLFELSLSSLMGYFNEDYKLFFVTLRENGDSDFIASECKRLEIHDYEIVELNALTDGQATSCMAAIRCCDKDTPVLIYNIDTYVEPYCMSRKDLYGDGVIPCFKADGDHWSFVRLNDDGDAVEVAEKRRISEYCSIGAYYFRTAALYEYAYHKLYDGSSQNGEKYIAPMYNVLIEDGMRVRINLISSDKVHPLGTPDELQRFVEAHPQC